MRVPTTTRTLALADAAPLVGALALRRARCGAAPTSTPRSARSRSMSGVASAISGTSTSAERPTASAVRDRAGVDGGLAARGLALEQERQGTACGERVAGRGRPPPPGRR